MKMKYIAIFKTLLFNISVLLIIFLMSYVVHRLHYMVYALFDGCDICYFMVILYSSLKALLVFMQIAIINFLLTSSKNIFSFFLDLEYIKKVDIKKLKDLRTMVNIIYKPLPVYEAKSFIIISSTVMMIILLIYLYFLTAFIIDMFTFICDYSDNVSYVIIIIVWTMIFTGFFHLFYYKSFTTCSKEIYIYLLLLVLYTISLLINKNIFDNFFLYYTPFNDTLKDNNIQEFLHNYIYKYSGYIVDWAVIQGIILAVLIYFKFGQKRQNSYEIKLENRKEQYCAILTMLEIIEEIYEDSKLKEYCLNISNNIKNGNLIYKDKLLQYNKKILQIYPKIKETNFNWVLSDFSLEFLTDEKFEKIFIYKSNIMKLRVCYSCKILYFSNNDNKLCENCTNHFVAK